LTKKELIDALFTFDSSLQDIDHALFEQLVEIAKTRIKTLKEYKEMVTPFLYPKKIEKTTQQKEIAHRIVAALQDIVSWEKQSIADVLLQQFVQAKVISFKDLYIMVIGTDRGLPLADMFAVLGKEKTLALFESHV
jgi:lysyl-tRNA synthetase class I